MPWSYMWKDPLTASGPVEWRRDASAAGPRSRDAVALLRSPARILVMKLAAIDLGSNSLHMVIVEVSGSGAFRVIDREKEMVRLGALTLSRGQLSAAAMKRGLEALAKYRRLAATHSVDK